MLVSLATMIACFYQLYHQGYSGRSLGLIITTDEELCCPTSYQYLKQIRTKSLIDLEAGIAGMLITHVPPTLLTSVELPTRYTDPQSEFNYLHKVKLYIEASVYLHLQRRYPRLYSQISFKVSLLDHRLTISVLLANCQEKISGIQNATSQVITDYLTEHKQIVLSQHGFGEPYKARIGTEGLLTNLSRLISQQAHRQTVHRTLLTDYVIISQIGISAEHNYNFAGAIATNGEYRHPQIEAHANLCLTTDHGRHSLSEWCSPSEAVAGLRLLIAAINSNLAPA